MLIILVAVSASHAIDRRPAINLAWEWVALGIVYLLLRNLPRHAKRVVGSGRRIVATAFAVSAYGLYQVARSSCRCSRQSFERNPQEFSRRLGIEAGSRGEEMFKNRLMGSNEPWSTFALANSLAGFIVGAACAGAGRRDLQPRPPGRTGIAVGGAGAGGAGRARLARSACS